MLSWGDGYLPRSVSLMPPMVFCTLPFTWSPLPSDLSLESPNTLPATSFTLPLARLAEPLMRSLSILALQLRFLRSSESIGHHDSEIVDDGYFDRDDAGALGVIAAGCQSAHGALVHPGAGGGFCGLIPGRTTRRRAAQDRLDACGSGGRSRSLAPAGHSGSRMVGR